MTDLRAHKITDCHIKIVFGEETVFQIDVHVDPYLIKPRGLQIIWQEAAYVIRRFAQP